MRRWCASQRSEYRRARLWIDDHAAPAASRSQTMLSSNAGTCCSGICPVRDGSRAFPQNPAGMPPTLPLSVFRRQPDAVAAEAWFAGRAGQAILASQAECPRCRAAATHGPRRGVVAPGGAEQACMLDDAALLRLQPEGAGFSGDLRCALSPPLASECCGPCPDPARR